MNLRPSVRAANIARRASLWVDTSAAATLVATATVSNGVPTCPPLPPATESPRGANPEGSQLLGYRDVTSGVQRSKCRDFVELRLQALALPLGYAASVCCGDEEGTTAAGRAASRAGAARGARPNPIPYPKNR
jgi:hypothetical protein